MIMKYYNHKVERLYYTTLIGIGTTVIRMGAIFNLY